MNCNGTIYKPNGVVVLDVDLVPTFGIITDILAIAVDNYHLICEVADTECFHSHFHSYELHRNEDPNFVVCKHKELADHYVLSAYKLESYPDSLFVSMKYYVMDTV